MRGAGLVLLAGVLFVTALGDLALTGNSALAATGFPPSTNVVLFTPPNSDPLVARLEAELAAVGIGVRRLAMPPESQLDAAITREIASGASAAIRVIPRSRGTEVWTGDTTARMLRRRSIRADTSDAALSVIALRTVEFLRASLLDVKRRGAANPALAKNPTDQTPARETTASEKVIATEKTIPAEKVAPTTVPVAATPVVRPPETPSVRLTETPTVQPAETPAVRTVEKPPDVPNEKDTDSSPKTPTDSLRRAKPDAESARFAIAAGPAMVASAGGTTPITAAAVLGRAWFTRWVGIEMMAVFPMVPSRLDSAEGSIEFRAALFGGGVTFRLTPPGRWTADATGGACAILFRATGSGVGTVGGAPNMGQAKSIWKAAGHVRLGGGVEINRWLVLRADVFAGVTPSSRITLEYSVTNSTGITTVVDRATWGPTFAAGTVSLQAAW